MRSAPILCLLCVAARSPPSLGTPTAPAVQPPRRRCAAVALAHSAAALLRQGLLTLGRAKVQVEHFADAIAALERASAAAGQAPPDGPDADPAATAELAADVAAELAEARIAAARRALAAFAPPAESSAQGSALRIFADQPPVDRTARRGRCALLNYLNHVPSHGSLLKSCAFSWLIT